jgi:hypothetical protein
VTIDLGRLFIETGVFDRRVPQRMDDLAFVTHCSGSEKHRTIIEL